MIAVDVMGGDHAPNMVLEGAYAAACKSVPVMLYGPEAFICGWLDKKDPLWGRYAITVANAPDVIAMDEDPVGSVRHKQQSSLVSAVRSVANNQCSAVLSAGNSGALMAAATLVVGRGEGVERPAIAGFLPTRQGHVLALDLGANTECRPQHLYQFAHMGNSYIQDVLGKQNPRIGLLANGHEEGKGSSLVKEAHQLLKTSSLNFIGNVEPGDIIANKADVIVCDGFAGNILLKTMEAMCDMIGDLLSPEEQQRVQNLSYKGVGGALLLGIKRPVIVCHGKSDAATIENAVHFAWSVSRGPSRAESRGKS